MNDRATSIPSVAVHRTASTLFVLALGCAGPTTAFEGTSSTSTSTSVSEPGTTAAPSATTGSAQPMGPCPLEGMFTDCSIGDMPGVAYCDVFEDGMRWGPCIESAACELGKSFEGCPCTLVEGIPTIVSADGCCAVEAGLPVCSQTSCVQRWDFACTGCASFSAGDCFSFDQQCAAPTLDCDLEMPCLPVLAIPDENPSRLAVLEDAPAAPCMLEALRDGTPGVYEVGWGASYEGGWITERVYAPGDGTVFTEWSFDCPSCADNGSIGRTGVMPLRPAEYFDNCLSATTHEELILCTVGLLDFEPESPPPPGYLPPFVAGDCTSLEPLCP